MMIPITVGVFLMPAGRIDMTQQLALQIARRAHKGKVDKLGNDYILHPVRIDAQFSDDANARIVALLLDVIEDTIGNPLGERVTYRRRSQKAVHIHNC